MRSSWVAIVLATTACGGGGGRDKLGPGGGGGAGALGATLTREVGAGVPVAIVPTAEGLRAVSADGARQRLLVPGPIRWASVDARAGVVWFGTPDATTIQVLDLESPAARPAITTVVTGLPTETDAGVPLVTISYPEPNPEGPVSDDLDLGHPITPHVILEVSAEPRVLAAGGSILELWEQQEAFAARVQEAQLAEPALLARLAARGKGRSLAIPRPADQRRIVLEDLSACEDAEMCGRAEAVTPTRWRVVTSYSCGDGCYLGWQLYDVERKALVEGDWAKMISDAWLAPDGSAFVTGGQVVRLDRGALAETPASEGDAVHGGGWLGGGSYLP